MIEGLAPELAGHEALKGFNTADELAKAHIETHGRVAAGAIDLLPEEVRKDPALSVFKTLPDLAKGFLETKKLVGTIKRPPADVGGYKFTVPEKMNPKVGDPKGFQAAFAAEALKAGLSEDQADAAQRFALSFFSGMIDQSAAKVEETRRANEVALRKEWPGEAYDKNLNTITRALKAAAGSDTEAQTIIAEVAETLKGRPAALRAFGKIVSQLSESTIDNLGGPAGGADADTEKEYSSYAEAIRTNDQKHPLFDRKHKDYNLAQEKWPKLQAAHFAKQK